MTITVGTEHPLPQIEVARCLAPEQIVVHQDRETINACIDGKVIFKSSRPGKAFGAKINIHAHARVRENVVMEEVTDETGGLIDLTIIIRREITSLRVVLRKHWAYARGLEIEIGNASHHQASGVVVRNADSHAALMVGNELVVIIGITPDQFIEAI